MKFYLTLIFAFTFIFIANISAQPNREDITELNQAGIELFQHLAKNNPQHNVFISPYSISNSLAMVYNGARVNTKEQIQNTLHFNKNLNSNNQLFKNINDVVLKRSSENDLLLSNAIWIEESYQIENTFSSVVTDCFKANAKSIAVKSEKDQIKSSEQINAWVKQNTQSKIDNIISPKALDEDSRLVLTNAIYFKGTWEYIFEKNATRSNYFSSIDGGKSEQNFMNRQGQFAFFEEENYKVIEMPYANNEFSFIAILPSNVNNISNLETSLNANSLNLVLNQLNKIKVSVSIPKFSNMFNIELKDSYIKLGMPTPFSNKANFTGINERNELKIDQIYHQSYFKIDEEGSEAAGATAVVISTKSATINTNKFIANKPFIYLIKENKTGLILFIGRQVKF